jgi:hypothetical protein
VDGHNPRIKFGDAMTKEASNADLKRAAPTTIAIRARPKRLL